MRREGAEPCSVSTKEEDFQQYLAIEAHTVVCWLDDERALAALESRVRHTL
jgi:hypothetical protein